MIPLSLAVALHALAAVVWVGGMMFAYAFLRPVAGRVLDGPARLALWRGVFGRFFPVVWAAIAVLLLTGYYMVLGPFGGFGSVGQHVHAMHGLALVMTAIFAHLFFAPWKRFRKAVDAGDNESSAAELERIRRFIAINLVLGLIVVVVATGGRYWY
ncbi:MAG: CopD family protein [Halofilum sp. (in: g-proteobacteria)]|nr:CopD family protein [Halofilum sp. (in: g-proteobacteria)]